MVWTGKNNDLLQSSAYKFTDQEQDDGTGPKLWDYNDSLYNYDARLYDPDIGQFIMADTIVPDPYNPQSLNRYSYCLNNPLGYIDPSGHDEEWLQWLQELWDDFFNWLDGWSTENNISTNYDDYNEADYPPDQICIENGLDMTIIAKSGESEGVFFQSIFDLDSAQARWDAIQAEDHSNVEITYGEIPIGFGAKFVLSEAKTLVNMWSKGSFNTVFDSIRYHAKIHGQGNVMKYLRKAANFNYKGARKIGLRADGTVRYVRKNGEYIIKKGGKIISYGN